MMRIIALIASLIVGAQLIISWISGSIICPNDGCEILKSLTALSPLYLNIFGLVFFQTIFWASRYLRGRSFFGIDFIGLVLLSGLSFDTALIAYQFRVAQALCLYCLFIFGFVVLLNLLYGRRQLVTGLAIAAAIFLSFAVLVFIPTGAFSKSFSLKNAAFGVKSCSRPTKEIYLIFSSNCPHCHRILETLNNCNSCDFYLNPIDEVNLPDFIEFEKNPGFSTQTNRLVLAAMGIDSVPVLVVKNTDGYRFIKGEKNILNYVRRACFTHDKIFYIDPSISKDDEDFKVITGDEGECSVEINCP